MSPIVAIVAMGMPAGLRPRGRHQGSAWRPPQDLRDLHAMVR